jgi:hypothetical protein
MDHLKTSLGLKPRWAAYLHRNQLAHKRTLPCRLI